tara:strand:- start:685 stop:1158 length:474 start_codon:yes stop_codon:yes gene_type:complete
MFQNIKGKMSFYYIFFILSIIFSEISLAHHTETHFEESSKYKIVYQCNKSDERYLLQILFSAGELIRKHGDDVQIVIACMGPGVHLLIKDKSIKVKRELKQKAASLAEYGVAFHVCGNTLKSINLKKDDLFQFSEVVPIGVEGVMLLQRQGFSYFAW